jgi:hypothetical protein
MTSKTPFTAKERAFEKMDLRQELESLSSMIRELKVEYEQYFTGLLPLAPDKLHNDVKRKIRQLLKAPLKSSAISFRLKTLEGRYNVFNTYWQRVLKEREEGRYYKDVFKNKLREKIAHEEAHSQTLTGKAEKNMQALFSSYKDAFQKATGKHADLNYQAFQKSLVERSKELKERHKDKKISFKVVVTNGKVSIKAKLKSNTNEKNQSS